MPKNYYVIDTNVFIVANGKAKHLSDEETDKCKLFVASLFSDTIISLDLQREIFAEYIKYMNLSGQPGLSDAFIKQLWDRQYDKPFCEFVDIKKNKKGIYRQLSNKEDLLRFDSNDLKFIAVYLGSKNPVSICNASDSDWENNKSLLSKYNIKVYEVLQKEY